MNRRSLRFLFSFVICVLVFLYFRIGILLQGIFFASIDGKPNHDLPEQANASNSISTTKIVAFCNYNFRSVGVKWYERMTRLGYDNHVIVVTDLALKTYLSKRNFRIEVALPEPLPAKYMQKKRNQQERAVLDLLFAVRWKYLLSQLKQGNHILLTDVDNIFSRFINVQEEIEKKDLAVDVWHAYATKFPPKNFAKLGFTVCGGMSWWRASKPAIRFAEIIHRKCGILCDDQRVLNNLLTDSTLNMTWNWTPAIQNSRTSNKTTQDDRFLGLPTLGISGTSKVTGHKAQVWDRDFAYRGTIDAGNCPKNNWVSMPILSAKSRSQSWIAKLESFDIWDQTCGSSYK